MANSRGSQPTMKTMSLQLLPLLLVIIIITIVTIIIVKIVVKATIDYINHYGMYITTMFREYAPANPSVIWMVKYTATPCCPLSVALSPRGGLPTTRADLPRRCQPDVEIVADTPRQRLR